MQKTIRILGIHLAGAHTRKSAAVRASVTLQEIRSGLEPGPAHDLFRKGMEGRFPGLPCVDAKEQRFAPRPTPLLWEAYASEIGPSSHRDGDTRFVEVVADMGGADVVVIDAPLTLPPCVGCTLPCPGTLKCVVPDVALMREAWERKQAERARDRNKRVRLPQPYVDRAYEVFARNHFEHPLLSGTFELESALGSNRAPVTARAVRLAREMQTRFPDALIVETNSALATLGWSLTAGYKLSSLLELRSVQSGRSARAGMLKRLEQRQIALRSATLHEQLFADFAENATVFHAGVAALTGWGLLTGEIYLPEDFLKLDARHPLRGFACVPKEAAQYAWGH